MRQGLLAFRRKGRLRVPKGFGIGSTPHPTHPHTIPHRRAPVGNSSSDCVGSRCPPEGCRLLHGNKLFCFLKRLCPLNRRPALDAVPSHPNYPPLTLNIPHKRPPVVPRGASKLGAPMQSLTYFVVSRNPQGFLGSAWVQPRVCCARWAPSSRALKAGNFCREYRGI